MATRHIHRFHLLFYPASQSPSLSPLTSPGFDLLGVRFAPLSVPMERRLQTLAVLFYVFIFILLSPTTLAVSLYLFFYSESYSWVPVLYVAWMVYDYDVGENGGRKSW